MDNIIFRGKRINRNMEWGYGDLRKNDGNTWIFPHDQDAAYDADMVDPKTVGMFTGLLDKNGKGIFEGDIITYMNPFPNRETTGRVYYDNGGFKVEVYVGAVISMPLGYLFGDDIKENTIEVVGNIHDNPDFKPIWK